MGIIAPDSKLPTDTINENTPADDKVYNVIVYEIIQMLATNNKLIKRDNKNKQKLKKLTGIINPIPDGRQKAIKQTGIPLTITLPKGFANTNWYQFV